MRRELHSLSAALKKSVPFHSPRYIGHMGRTCCCPAWPRSLLTLPYNPNNVSEDAAPVTVEMEVRAGLQLARMLGYPDDPARDDCAFRTPHLRRHARQLPGAAAGFGAEGVPVALRAAGVPDIEPAGRRLECINTGTTAGIALLDRWQRWLANQPADQRRVLARTRAGANGSRRWGWSISSRAIAQLSPPRVLAPVTAHTRGARA
jgi:hypothetical protein